MLPPKELNPSDADLFELVHAGIGEQAGMNLYDRITELEARNLYLQSLVVELLDKNEQLRRKVMQERACADTLSQ
jgi:hypothetical protein